MSRRKLQLVLVVGVMSLLGAVGVAVATGGRDIRERLSGYEEDPLTFSTPMSGEFKAKLDRSAQEIEWRLSYRDTPTAVTQAHIHFGGSAQSGGISVFFCTNLGNGPAGTQTCPNGPGTQTITGTIKPTDVLAVANQGFAAGGFDQLLDAIANDVTYVNVHSVQYPGGEIRAQLEPSHDN